MAADKYGHLGTHKDETESPDKLGNEKTAVGAVW